MKQVGLGDIVTVTVDRPMNTRHPNHPEIFYPINYGYVEGIIGGDGEEQDAYILGINKPVEKFTGRIIAIIERLNDNETKWVVAPIGKMYTERDIRKYTSFMEKYFKSVIHMK